MHLNVVSIISFFAVLAPLIAFLVIVTLAWRKTRTEEAQGPSLDKLKQLKLADWMLLLKRLAAGTMIAAFTIGTPIGLFALIAFFPTISCHGEGSGGNCGEGYLASLPLSWLTIPVDLVAAFFVCKISANVFWKER